MAQYSKNYSLLTRGTSAITSRNVLVVDAAEMSVSVLSVAASVVSIEASNDHGLNAAIPDNSWSNVTVLTAIPATGGIFAIQPGMRWLRVRQAASSSSNTVTLSLTVR
jgi:hypothetical protein